MGVKRLAGSLAIVLLVLSGSAIGAEFDALDVMFREVQRSMQLLKKEDEPPYYISYEVTEDVAATVSGAFGKATSENYIVSRYLDIDLRLGDYSLDNTHPLRGGLETQSIGPSTTPIEDEEALRTTLWLHTDIAYKQALVQFTRVKSAVQSSVRPFFRVGDFSKYPVRKYSEPRVELDADLAQWKDKIREYTQPFAEAEFIQENYAYIFGDVETRWFVNSDGTRVLVSQPYYRLVIQATSKADDGMELTVERAFDASTPDKILQDDTVLHAVHSMITDLKALRSAPVVEPYTGPAILSGKSTGVFFHEVLGRRVEGHRQRLLDEGQTFYSQINKRLLPRSFSVVFDPTINSFDGVELVGDYKFDNQGVEGQRVVVVNRGVLEDFLMSKTPIMGYFRSNGHGRKNYGFPVVSRQSNLFVEVRNPHTREELETMLMDRIREQGKPFGLYFADVRGGDTLTGRSMPNTFNVNPIMVYLLYPDGTKELVRGVDLIGTPLITLSRIEAGADDIEVFNDVSDAESGQLPVSTVAPSILISQIEVQKTESSRDTPPILPSPVRHLQEQSSPSAGKKQ